MLQTSLSAILGLLFISVGALNIWLIFHSTSRLKNRGASATLVKAHRIGGYLFIMLFSVMTYFMILKVKDTPDELSLRPMIHMLLAMLMVPVLFIKVLVARYYKTYYSVLMPLGIIIFTLSFLLVSMTVGPYLLRKATIKDISLESVNMGNNKIDVEAAQVLMQKKCSKCHNLDRVVSAKKDARAWLASINRMRALPGSGFTEAEATSILSYLVAQNPTESASTQVAEVGKSLTDNRCNRCHDLDRVYSQTKTADEWRSVVTRMVGYSQGNDGIFKPGDDEQITKFLADTQTAEAVAKRKNTVADASAKNASLVKPATPIPAEAPPSPLVNGSTITMILVLSGFFGLLMLRRPGTATTVPTVSEPLVLATTSLATRSKAPQPVTPELRKTSMILQLARIDTQTPDAKTLRFLVPEGDRFWARPGQFLTFNWMVDGKKVVRSYSICSSPTQTGYVEITPKRVENGRVSTFLNERAAVGLTVEAKGPSGQFFFDETKQSRIVMLAAGSGITPMISMLRYIDDRCLSTDATLIYFVRTRRDIIFEKELSQLKSRLNNFRYAVSLTKPDGEWKGASGYFSSAMLDANLKDTRGVTFFLCGPKAFMEQARELLKKHGVDEAFIKQESFGGPAAAPTPSIAPDAAEGSVEFARSRKVCPIPADRSLLEVAELNSVAIPFSCRQGQCGTCTTRLLEGEVVMDAEDGLDPELKAEGYVLTCVGRAKGRVKLDV